MRRQLSDAQCATRDVDRVVDRRLNEHLPAILEAAYMVWDERISPLTVEQAFSGWVPKGYTPHSTANPNFWEICATLVCAAVLRVDPPPSLEALSRHADHGTARSPVPDGGRRAGAPAPHVTVVLVLHNFHTMLSCLRRFENHLCTLGAFAHVKNQRLCMLVAGNLHL